jgi:putative membrane protein
MIFRCGFGGAFIFIIFLVIVAALIYHFPKISEHHNFSNNSAISILKEKYASGEISEEEYLRKKKILESK